MHNERLQPGTITRTGWLVATINSTLLRNAVVNSSVVTKKQPRMQQIITRRVLSAELIDRHTAMHTARPLHLDFLFHCASLEIDDKHVTERHVSLLTPADNKFAVESREACNRTKSVVSFALWCSTRESKLALTAIAASANLNSSTPETIKMLWLATYGEKTSVVVVDWLVTWWFDWLPIQLAGHLVLCSWWLTGCRYNSQANTLFSQWRFNVLWMWLPLITFIIKGACYPF